MKKQTAVEWLEDALSLSLMIRSESMTKFTVRKLIEQAKEMEKQQIIDAINFFKERPHLEIDAEQYYTETFNN
jgi:hypothetical protein